MLIGLFALSEGFRQVEVIVTAPKVTAVIRNILPDLQDLKACLPAYLRACPIGLMVGITPAIGADTAAFLSYAETKRASKHPERFGTGVPEGVAAAQCGENASTGGDVLPMITLGIPGDAATAVLMGALTIHNLQPGPMLFRAHPEVVHQIFAGMILANLAFVVLGLAFARFFAQVINIDRTYLVPLVFICCMVGAYAINNVFYDLVTCVAFGFIGYLMLRYDFPVAPMVLAQILGGMMESNFRRALAMSRGDPSIFLMRPITVGILALAMFTAIVAVRRQREALRETSSMAA
jgi:putative tricarboxylic transport membrane protein